MNRGLGVCIAEKFAAEGCNVAINYLASQQQADDLALRLEGEYKIKTVTIQGVRCLAIFAKEIANTFAT
jgi:NAD(P)-dependent dehydrogenase (short-subunit alcohol dehydrogenase family)